MTLLQKGVKIVATGSFVPTTSLNNFQLSKIVETSNEWIAIRTGIKSRCLLEPEYTLVDAAVEASLKALESSCLLPSDIDLIILATSTPDDLFGSAPKVQSRIGATNAIAFDITAACSGFVIGLINAYQFIQTGTYKNILLIGADVLSRRTNWSNRNTCILFGDAAGAAILQSSEEKNILGFKLETDGTLNKHLQIDSTVATLPLIDEIKTGQSCYNYIQMNGPEVYKAAISKVPQNIKESLKMASLLPEDIDWLILHQANSRILQTVAERLNIPSSKILTNLEKYGNTSAASIPLILDESIRKGKIKQKHILIISGFGAGFTLGSIILRWI